MHSSLYNIAHFVSSKTLKVLEDKVLFLIRTAFSFLHASGVWFFVGWLKKQFLRAAVICRIACYFIFTVVGDKMIVCVCSGRSGCMHFFNVTGGVLGILQFDLQIHKGGWEGVEALAGEVPILINLFSLYAIIDWMKQRFFCVEAMIFCMEPWKFLMVFISFDTLISHQLCKKTFFFKLTSDDAPWKKVHLN